MSESDIDQLIIDLKVIASLNQNIKLMTKGCYLNSEQSHFVPEWIRRWLRGDSRDETVKRIDQTVISSINKLKIISGKSRNKLKEHLKKSVVGIENLRKTYSTCAQTNARLNAIIDKINLAMDDDISNNFGFRKLTKVRTNSVSSATEDLSNANDIFNN